MKQGLESLPNIIDFYSLAEFNPGGISCGKRAAFSIATEASSIKAGNVHPGASFPNMTFSNFVAAAEAIGNAIDFSEARLGSIILAATRSMMEAAGVNTSLGTILLIAPICLCARSSLPMGRSSNGAASWSREIFHEQVSSVIAESSAAECEMIYGAIRLANPGGMGTSHAEDVYSSPSVGILDAMRLAAARDDVALQYCNGYLEVVRLTEQILADCGTQRPLENDGVFLRLNESIRRLQIELLAVRPDSLIVRKYGREVGAEVSSRAREVLESGDYGTVDYEMSWQRFDRYLRDPSCRKNPGTTADLIAAAVFLASYAWG